MHAKIKRIVLVVKRFSTKIYLIFDLKDLLKMYNNVPITTINSKINELTVNFENSKLLIFDDIKVVSGGVPL